MTELYELRDKLCRELKKYNSEEVTTNSLEVVDKLAHAIKNIDKIIENYKEDEGKSYIIRKHQYNSTGKDFSRPLKN